MKNVEEVERIVVNESEFIYQEAPKTHIFYEYQGECTVDPLRLVMDGFVLWHEQARDNTEHRQEVLQLWDYAKNLLAKRHKTSKYSYVEWLRYEVTMGLHDPKKWHARKVKKPYHYRGMLVSAIYLQEAMKLCEEGCHNRVWHIVTMAYYHLGMNSTPSSSRNAAKRAKKKNEQANINLHGVVLGLLDALKMAHEKNPTVKSINAAKKKIIKAIESLPDALALVEQADSLRPEKTKHDKTNSALDRLGNLLDNWASSKGPYPDIAEAFSSFDSRRAPKHSEPDIPFDALDPNITHYMRIVNQCGHVSKIEEYVSEKASECE